MNPGRIFILTCFSMLVINLFAVVYDLNWLSITTEVSIYFLLLFGFFKKLDFANMNVISFLGLSMIAVLFKFFQEESFVYLIIMFFQMAAYIFLTREALRYTQRETANKFMLIFFFLMIGANCYFVFRHFQELENKIAGMVEIGFYSLYYLNLLVLAITGLVYYLNSYSRKSVYFISMVLAIVVSDILRDMILFYLPETSVLLLHSILQFCAVVLAFQFYVTKEKKLKLINLV